MPKQSISSGVSKREIPDAEFRMVEENLPRSSAPAFSAKTAFAIFVAIMCAIGIWLFYVQMPRLPKGGEATQDQHEEEFVPDLEYIELIASSPTVQSQEDHSPSPVVNQRELRRSILVHLDEVWMQAKTD